MSESSSDSRSQATATCYHQYVAHLTSQLKSYTYTHRETEEKRWREMDQKPVTAPAWWQEKETKTRSWPLLEQPQEKRSFCVGLPRSGSVSCAQTDSSCLRFRLHSAQWHSGVLCWSSAMSNWKDVKERERARLEPEHNRMAYPLAATPCKFFFRSCSYLEA